VQDLDGEVLALLAAQHLAPLLLEDLACTVMRVDDVVTELELDVLDRADLQVLQQLLFDGFGNDVLLGLVPAPAGYE